MITAITRHPEKITSQDNNLTSRQMNVLNTTALATMLVGHHLIISAYNPGWGTPDLYEQFLAGSTSIQNATRAAAIPRLIIIGHAGSLFVAPALQWVDTPEYPAAWRPGPAAARDYLNLLKEEKHLDWTYVSPPLDLSAATSNIRTGHYRIGTDSPVYNDQGKSTISVEDFAVAVLDEAESPRHSRQSFTVAY